MISCTYIPSIKRVLECLGPILRKHGKRVQPLDNQLRPPVKKRLLFERWQDLVGKRNSQQLSSLLNWREVRCNSSFLGYPSTQHGPTQGLQHGKDLFHKPFRKGFGSKRRGANLATRPRGTDFTVSTNKRPRSQPVLSMSFHNRGLVQDGRSDSCTTRVPPRMPGDGCPLSKTSSGQRASV